jgi:Bardet-Biedl syndrome 1 protein
MSRDEIKHPKGPWLHAWSDALAGLQTSSSNIQFLDALGDGDSKLAITDFSKKLKVYKGTFCMETIKLLGQPVAMAALHMDESSPRIPVLAVAAGSYIFVFRMLRPYLRYKCPDVSIVEAEREIWKGLDQETMKLDNALDLLKQTRDAGNVLTSRSTELLALNSLEKQNKFIKDCRGKNLVQQTVITCMGTLKKTSHDIDAVSLLVFGTEANHILIKDAGSPTGFLCEVSLPVTPVMLSITGLFDVEWRISVACRDGKVYSIKNGDSRGTAILTGTVIDPGGSQVVAMVRQDKLLWIADMDRNVASFTVRGKRTQGITLSKDKDITELLILPIQKGTTVHVLMIGTSDGDVMMYTTDLRPIYFFKVERPVVAMKFGSYGREESALVIVHGQSSSLTTKVLRRLVDLDALRKLHTDASALDDTPIPVPKKTKMFLEQTKREREYAEEMHRNFQRDLCILRLNTARSYVKTLTNANMGGPMNNSASEKLRIYIKVEGLGPNFLLKICLQNMGQSTVVRSKLLFAFDTSIYELGHGKPDDEAPRSVAVNILLPGLKHVVEVPIRCIRPDVQGDVLVVLMSTKKEMGSLPLVSASVKMPLSEMDL